MHAPQAISSMRAGFPVYVQKPLAHDIHEVRTLMKMAHARNLPTQMGIQIHSRREYKTAVKLIPDWRDRQGKRGPHVERGRSGGDLAKLPTTADPVPSGFNWDQWLERGGNAAVHQRCLPSGETGAKGSILGPRTFGDMGCHILDPVFGALQLGSPLSVRSEGAAPNGESWALDTLIRYVFPGTPFTAEKTVPVTWYDGDCLPPDDVYERWWDR